MIMIPSYKEDFIEKMNNLSDARKEAFAKKGIDPAAMLSDNDMMERLWYLYQKSVCEYECDEDYSFADALHEVFGIEIYEA